MSSPQSVPVTLGNIPSEAERGGADFHAAEIACGFVEELPTKTPNSIPVN